MERMSSEQVTNTCYLMRQKKINSSLNDDDDDNEWVRKWVWERIFFFAQVRRKISS